VGVTTAERLCCDARIETVWQDGSKRPVGIGRASRKVPPWLYRQLRRRDLTCVFSGCPRDKFLEAHHRLPWWAGGPTDLDNLSVKLCPLCLASLEASTAVPSQR
jgi:hypothetical protein